MLQLNPTDPTVKDLHPRLFVVEEWRDLIKPRRRRCDHCGSYMWFDLDSYHRERLVCSACGWEE